MELMEVFGMSWSCAHSVAALWYRNFTWRQARQAKVSSGNLLGNRSCHTHAHMRSQERGCESDRGCMSLHTEESSNTLGTTLSLWMFSTQTDEIAERFTFQFGGTVGQCSIPADRYGVRWSWMDLVSCETKQAIGPRPTY